MADSSMRRLVEEIFGLNQRLRALELTPQLGSSSLEDSALEVYDSEGNLTAIIGANPDGSAGMQILDGPTPSAPRGISFTGGPKMIEVAWTGEFVEEEPLDFSFIAIHASIDPNFVPTASNTVGTISVIEETSRIIPISAAGYFIKATTVSLANKRSEPTSEAYVEVEELVDEESIKQSLEAERTAREQAYEEASLLLTELDDRLSEIDGLGGDIEQLRDKIETDLAAAKSELEAANADLSADLNTLEGDLTQAKADLDELGTVTLPGAIAGLQEADDQVRTQLTELDGTLNELDTVVSGHGTNLTTLTDNYATVAQAVQEAQAAADEANAQALLAAGIADSKGKIIYSETEPPVEDRSTSNLWVVPSTGESRAWDEDQQEWVVVQNEALDAALAAAQKAQQRADTAVSNAAVAQAAAEAAQRTADGATLDAREAHNEAVAAQDAADQAQEWIDSGINLVPDPSRTGSIADWSVSQGSTSDLSIEERDMGRGPVTALKHQNTGHTTVYSPYFNIDPTQAYQFKITFDKPETHPNASSDFYFGINASLPSGVLRDVDYIRTSDSKVSATGSNFYFWYRNGPYDGPTELTGYVLPIGVSNEVAGSLGNGVYNARLTDPKTSRMRLRFLNYANEDLSLPVWVSNVSVRAVSVEDLVRAKEAHDAADAAQDRADEAYTEAASKITEAQAKAVADTAQAAAEATARAEIQAAEARAATEALRIAKAEAEREATEAEAAAKAYADLQASGASGDALASAKAYAEEQAEEARIAAEAAAAADATAKAETAESNAAIEAERLAKAEAAKALADAERLLDDVTKPGGVIDRKVTASANGKNSITHSTSAPSANTPGSVEGDTWYRIDLDNRAYAQWRWDGSRWDPVTIRNEMIDSLDVNKLQAGSANISSAVIDKLWAQQMAVKKIQADNIAANSITAGQIAANAITASEIAANAVTANAVAANAIVAGNIQAGSVTVDKIATNAVTAVKISSGAITSQKIGAGAITADKLAANAVTADKLNVTNEMTAKLADIMELNVVNLKAGSGIIDDAVINKLWADGIAAKSVTASKLTISPGNLIAGEETWGNGPLAPASENPWRSFGMNTSDPSIWVAGEETGTRYIYTPIRVKAGSRYRFSVDVKGTKANTAIYARLQKGTDQVPSATEGYTNIDPKGAANGTYIVVSGRSGAANQWATITSEFTIEEDGWAWLRIWPNHTSGSSNSGGYQWFKNIRLQEMVGATIIEDGAISTDKLTADAVTADKIKALAIKTGHMQANSIDGDRIRVNTLSGDRIEANTISAEKISGGSFTGKTFSGGTFTGSEFRLVDTGGTGMILTPQSSFGNAAIFFSDNGTTDLNQAAVWRNEYDKAFPNELRLRAAHNADVRVEDALSAYGLRSRQDLQVDGNGKIYRNLTVGGGRDGSTGSIFAPNIDAKTFWVRHLLTVDEYIRGFRGGEIQLRNDGQPQIASKTIYNRTYSGSANVYVTSYGTLGRSTSSRRYKKNIANWSPDPKAVLKLQPRQWQHDDPEHNPEISEIWQVGFIAEEVDELGLKGLVDYSGDGAGGWRPESLRYDRFAAAHQVVLKKHEEQISNLETANEALRSENAELRDRLAAIEAKLEAL